ncbi:hypothetical protein SAMN03159297_01921 [Pseudomonas sp. NFACC45]|nr:hypothetical protein SAMN03159297_01921 [Pseudomonas sp. NFACC45]
MVCAESHVETDAVYIRRSVRNKSVVPFWIEIDDETTSALSLAA